MNDQTQQNAGTPGSQTTQTPASDSLASGSGNPWEDSPPGAAGEESNAQPGVVETTVPSTVQAPTQSTPTPAQPAAAPAGLSAEDISSLVAKTVGATLDSRPQQPAAVAAPQFTEADFIKTFQVFQPTPEILAAIGLPNTPETVSAFQSQIVTPIVRQAVTMAAFQLEKVKNELTEHIKAALQPYEPARQMAQTQVEAKLKEEFLATHEDLKGFEPLLEEIKDRLISQGVKFKSKDEAFKTIADHAKAIIAKIPGMAASNGQAVQPQTNTTNGGGSRMSTLSGGGQGGAAAARPSTNGKKKNTSEALWGANG